MLCQQQLVSHTHLSPPQAREAGPAAVWLWDCVETWKGYQSLPAHSLTVVQLAFSPDDRYGDAPDGVHPLLSHC